MCSRIFTFVFVFAEIGEVVLCKITKVNSKNDSRCVVKVTNKFDQGHVEAFKKSENLNYSTLVPGMLLKPFVEEVRRLILHFLHAEDFLLQSFTFLTL